MTRVFALRMPSFRRRSICTQEPWTSIEKPSKQICQPVWAAIKDQRDCAIVQLQWKNDLGDVIRADTLPTVTNVSRENTTTLLRRGLSNLPVPTGTRKVTVVILARIAVQEKATTATWTTSLSHFIRRQLKALQMVFAMKDGEEATVSAVIDGNKLRTTGPDEAFVLADEINPTGGLLIRTKSIAKSAR